MPVCPACGLANDDSFQRCGRCGASLATQPFATVAPATRRMGRTMLGVAPLPTGGARNASPLNDTAPNAAGVDRVPDELQPFAPVPATLAGLNANVDANGAPEPGLTDGASPTIAGARTLAGFAAQPSESSNPAETLTGFGAEAGAMSRNVPAATRPATEDKQEREPRLEVTPKAPVGNATLLGMSPFVGRPNHPGTAHPAVEANPPNATLLGMSPLVGNRVQPDGAHPAAKAISPNATLMGVSPFTATQRQSDSAAAGPATPGMLKQTLLGVLPPQPEFRDAEHAEPALSPGSAGDTLSTTVPAIDPGAQTTKIVNPHQTLLGVSPVLATSAAAADPHRVPDPSRGAERAQQLKGTLLGVAMPGIAPLQPGQLKQSPSPVGSPLPLNQGHGTVQPRALRQPSSNPPTGTSTDRDLELRSKQWRGLAWIFGTAAALLAIVMVVALTVWWTNVRLTVQVTSSESGAEQLVLTCSNCPDGTAASIESKSSKFKDKRAAIELARRLTVGQNQLTLRVTRPNRSRSEVVNVTVPVDFRVTSSVAELAANPPTISVLLESTPGTRFVVEGHTHTVGTTGKLTVPIDVSTSLTGPASVVVPFERRLAYEVLRDGSAKKGTLVVRTGITALDVVTPGLTHITQNPTFTLSGKTGVQAQLTANGHPILVAQDGSFRQEMALSAPGSTKLVVRAAEPNQAPRLIEIALERVTNLRQRADELAKALVTDFDAVSTLISEKPDSVVAMRGEVVVIEAANVSTRIVGTASCRREPCLFSVRYGGPLALRAGSRFLSIGRARLSPRPTNAAEHDVTLDASLVVEDTSR